MINALDNPLPGGQGSVWWDLDTMEIVLQNGPTPTQSYRVDLERCRNAGEVLDWILQLAGKAWMTGELMMRFLQILDEACVAIFGHSAQKMLCPAGASRDVEWPQSVSGDQSCRTAS